MGNGHGQGIADQLTVITIAHGPADDLPGMQIDDGRQIQPALPGWNKRGVGHPGTIRLFRRKPPIQNILGHRFTVARGVAGFKPFHANGLDAVQMSQSGNPMAAAGDALLVEQCPGLVAAAGRPVLLMNVFYLHQ